MTTIASAIEVNDTVRIVGDSRLWIVDIICTADDRPYISVTRTCATRIGTSTISRKRHPGSVTLVRKGNAAVHPFVAVPAAVAR